MIPAELQLRDEALTAAGHDPECAAFDDRECSCGVTSPGEAIRKRKPVRDGDVVGLAPVGDLVTLQGDQARAFRRWQSAMQRLAQAKNAYAAAGQEAQAAQEALTLMTVGPAP